MHSILLFLAMLSQLPLWAYVKPYEVLFEHDNKVKIEYVSKETNHIGEYLDFTVKEDVQVKHNEIKYTVIKKGTPGKLRITRLSGLRNDLVMDVEASTTAIDGSEIKMGYYKQARKGLRKAVKVGLVAGLVDPIGIPIKLAETIYRRKTNVYNLPRKLYTNNDLFVRLADLNEEMS